MRKQLSMYVPPPNAALLEKLRNELDPVQANLIPAHVTLCREDELPSAMERKVVADLREGWHSITLEFGEPQRFSSHGVLLPCVGGLENFHALRCQILDSSSVKPQLPHITLAHPRNPKSVQNDSFKSTYSLGELEVTFNIISLIEQEGSNPWVVLKEFDLAEEVKRNG